MIIEYFNDILTVDTENVWSYNVVDTEDPSPEH